MSRRKVVITLVLDPTEYEGAEDSALGALDIVRDCINGGADFPPMMQVTCEENTIALFIGGDS